MKEACDNMLTFENENVEFKQEYVPEIRKEVIAFTNAEGGVILVGVRKDGVVAGVDDPDEVMQQITNSLKDSIAPDVMPFVSVNTVEMEGLQVVQIDVSTGTNRPYYLREKGLKPSGVYVRKGSSSQPMTDDGIREMIVRTSGKSYESCRSMNQSLTFDMLSYEIKKDLLNLATPR
jgi:ATP-dependent DNA helicase RecG